MRTELNNNLLSNFHIWFRYNSESYQVVDFGMGGITDIHLDEAVLPAASAFTVGGGFVATNILYLSNNIAGGKTVLPDAGVGVYPETGAMIHFSTKEYIKS